MTDRVDVGASVGSVAADDGSVWATTYDFDRDSAAVVHINAATDRVIATIPISGFAYNIAAGDGAAWVAVGSPRGGGSLVRIDEATDRITGAVDDVIGPVVVDATGIWAVSGSDVVQIDAASLDIRSRVSMPTEPFDLAAAGGVIWALGHPSDGTASSPLMEIDASTATVVGTADLRSSGTWIAADADGAWASGWRPDGSVADLFVPDSTGVPEEAGTVYNFRPFAVDEGRAWFISGPEDPELPKGGICGLNVSTHVVDVCVEPRSIVDLEGAHDPAAYEPLTQTIWVGEYESRFVTRIDIASASPSDSSVSSS